MTHPEATGAWHADPALLRAWVDGTAGALAGSSVEQHVASCGRCQAAVAPLVTPDLLAAVWADVLERVETPQPTRVERVLLRCGVAPADALVVASAATFRLAWTAAVIGVLGFTLLATVVGGGGVALYLMAAPLIPVAGVAMVYGPAADPSYEAAVATPYAMIRLALLRTAAVLVTSVPLTVVAGLLLPPSTETALAWLLPAAGFTVAVLTASNWVDPEQAAVVLSLGWISAVGLAGWRGDPLLVLQPLALLGYAVLLIGSAGVLLHRLLADEPSWRLR